jgi:hypothetical protein
LKNSSERFDRLGMNGKYVIISIYSPFALSLVEG